MDNEGGGWQAPVNAKNGVDGMVEEFVGKNSVWETTKVDPAVRRKLQLIKDLQGAQKRGEMHIAYQPKINPYKQQIVGMEALVRWEHPVYGRISPDEFIPFAERTGTIIPLGSWVIRMACLQLKKWHSAGHSQLHMAINLSAYQLQVEGFVENVSQILQELELSANFLQFEVTESADIYYNQIGIKRLHELKRLGIQIYMDDFGIGYSALSCLQRMPVDGIKIDRALTKQLGKDSVYQMMKAMIQLAQGLRLKVVVEGVDSDEKMSILKKWHVHEVQGFLFSQPFPPDELTQLLDQIGGDEG
ncbi:putative bifunctional diguanylate cyclase/phosphodiesterase [Brevibacillus migulae]|uniref:putative bifunctional diguanylate cyclase/phosphodiesterase n=1 Tax=Brevibacillus migulae TaxID=1644114 RepID=UPI001431BD6A|nr:EAL domain-containing protein [Brevibacillus migulae]